MKSTLHNRFFSKIVVGDNSCWVWQGGYNRFFEYAHRVSWILHRGSIPADLQVLHRCDNPSCVNPDHLFLGTQKDNVEDMMAKGRVGGIVKSQQQPSLKF